MTDPKKVVTKVEEAIRAAAIPELTKQAQELGDTLLHDFKEILKKATEESMARVTAHARRAAQFRLEAALERDPERAAELMAAAETAMRAVRVAVSAAGLVATERNAALIESGLRKGATILAEAAKVTIQVSVTAAIAAL